jgi:hypothetical protein
VTRPDLRAIATALFLPLLYWTGAVVAITLFGYPGVACMTPAAWLLALPVGLRVAQESDSPGLRRPVIEAAAGGGLLGFWQGWLLAAAMAAGRFRSEDFAADLPSPLLVGLAASLLSLPFTAGLAAAAAWLRKRRKETAS